VSWRSGGGQLPRSRSTTFDFLASCSHSDICHAVLVGGRSELVLLLLRQPAQAECGDKSYTVATMECGDKSSTGFAGPGLPSANRSK
jgi:hypothetical protein